MITSINYIDILNELFYQSSSKYANIEKWNELIFETSLYEFYKVNIYKFKKEEEPFIINVLDDGFLKINELKNTHISFINDYIYNSSYNSYNKELFIFETDLYFYKLKFMFADYTLNNTIIQHNFNAGLTSPDNNNLNYFLKENKKPYSFSPEYRSKLSKNLKIGGFIQPFSE